MSQVYLDHAATSPLCAEAWEAMEPFLSARYGNPSEPHRMGREARAAVEGARRTMAELLGCRPDQLVFTSGGTEADNQAVFGLCGRPLGRLVCSVIEHPAVRVPAEELARQGFEVGWAPVDADGVIDAAAFAELVREDDRVACAMWANNVTGVVQPVAELAAIAAARGVPLHVDAVQAAPAIPISFAASGAETMALSAHKVQGPKGVGALIARDPGRLRPLIWGGGQEAGPPVGHRERARDRRLRRRAGGVARAARQPAGAARPPRGRRRRDAGGLGRRGAAARPRAAARRRPARRPRRAGAGRGGLRGVGRVGVPAGSMSQAPRCVAQGMTPDEARAVIRVTIGPHSTEAEIDGFLDALRATVARLRSGALA